MTIYKPAHGGYPGLVAMGRAGVITRVLCHQPGCIRGNETACHRIGGVL